MHITVRMSARGGPDEDRLREFDTLVVSNVATGTLAFPSQYSLSLDTTSPVLPSLKRACRIDASCWPEITARSKRESLRDLAALYQVSHETIRRILKRQAESSSSFISKDESPLTCQSA
jgi:hypothetical protein